MVILTTRYVNCRHLNFDPTFKIEGWGGFSPSWKFRILELVDHFVVFTQVVLEVIMPYKNVKQKFYLDSKIFTGLYYRAWTIIMLSQNNQNLNHPPPCSHFFIFVNPLPPVNIKNFTSLPLKCFRVIHKSPS